MKVVGELRGKKEKRGVFKARVELIASRTNERGVREGMDLVGFMEGMIEEFKPESEGVEGRDRRGQRNEFYQ